MKKPLLIIAVFVLFICTGSCSDDDEKNTCASCTGTNIAYELCDNGNGTYTLSKGEATQTLTESDLLGVPIKEYVNLLCTEN